MRPLHRRTLVAAIIVSMSVPAVTDAVEPDRSAAPGTGPTEIWRAVDSARSTSATDDDIPPGARRSIGSPEAGPKPEHSGDRGGWAQLTLLGALALGVGFIMWRIGRAVHRGPAVTGEP